MPKGWGGVARRGARVVTEETSDQRRTETSETRERGRDHGGVEAGWTPEVWVEESSPAPRPPKRTDPESTRRPRAGLPEDVGAELAGALGPSRAPQMAQRLARAVRAYEADRYDEARRVLGPLAAAAPGAASVRELYGLTLYRMGRWARAVRELEAFHALTGSFDQHPVLADCHRALGHWDAVERLWDDLRRASPGADVVAEGRIVVAGARADRGDLAGAIRLLEGAPTRPKRPRLHHLRMWYATADLYERAGDLPTARALFRDILRHDPGFVDVPERLAALGS